MRLPIYTAIIALALPTLATAHSSEWEPRKDCSVKPRGDDGLIPEAYAMLESIGAEHRITQTLNTSIAPSNYHGHDVTIDGIDYTAAVDLSIRCLDSDDIKEFLASLTSNGFVAWYRQKNSDDWGDSPEHIHAIWAREPLKPQLQRQVQSWIDGRSGLVKNSYYEFWQPTDDTRRSLIDAYESSKAAVESKDPE